MLTLLILALPVAVIIAANVGARFVYRRKGFIAAAFTFLGILLLPFADAIPGYLIYRYYIAKHGGLRIYDSAVVSGYLGPYDSCHSGCIREFVQSPYRYAELYVSKPNPNYLTDRKGYAHIYMSSRGDPRCTDFYRLHEKHAGYFDYFDQIGIGDVPCIAVTYTATPISQYEWNSRGPYRESGAARFVWLRAYHVFVREIDSGRIIAETRTYRYRPWAGWFFGGPEFRFGSVVIPLTEVLIPLEEERRDDHAIN